MRLTASLLLSCVLAGSVAAHPGHDVSEEVEEMRSFLRNVERASLEHCAEKLKTRGLHERNGLRRRELLEAARQRRNIAKRDAEEVLGTDHNKTDLGYTLNTDASDIFSGSNSCILTPEVTQGPYYVGGEYVRQDVTEKQAGVALTLDYQVIDVDTCEPVSDVYLEIWHCNATGVYSGIVSSGNGDSSDSSNLDATWLRGIQKTDSDGVAQFDTIFPGHYTGRATHIHLMVHANATLYQNDTLGNDIYSSHTGQAFFDQTLITAVEKLSTYAANEQDLTTNEEDDIFAEQAATDGSDPVMEYTLLGDSVEDGLFAWLSFGVNMTQSSQVTPAAFLYAEGGVENENSGMGGGPGGGMGGGPPSGGPGGPPGSDVSASISAPAASSSSAVAGSLAAAVVDAKTAMSAAVAFAAAALGFAAV